MQIGYPRYNVWNEVLIPSFSDQRVLDQLWCADKVLQTIITRKLKVMDCWCRPMDAIIKPRGIYPSYIAQLTSLKLLTVDIEPRLKSIWTTFVDSPCRYDELFSDKLPLTLEYFETRLGSVFWDKAKIYRDKYVFRWLDRFKRIIIGPDMKMFVKDLQGLSITNISKLEIKDLVQLRYQYVTKTNLVNASEILAKLTIFDDIELITKFLAGITTLFDVTLDSLQRSSVIFSKLSEIQLTMLRNSTDDIIGPHGILCSNLSRLFPNLRELTGNIPCKVNGIVEYLIDDSHVSSADPRVPLTQLLSESLQVLPESLQVLRCSQHILEVEQLQLPRNLTELYIRSNYLYQANNAVTITQFNQLVRALPSTMKTINFMWLFDPGAIFDYWTVENVAALPRGLQTMRWLPFEWNIPAHQDISDLISSLPPTLTDLSLPQNLLPTQFLLLPKTLKSISLTIDAGTSALINAVVNRFTQLMQLTVNVTLSEHLLFPSLTLPDTLKNFYMTIDTPRNLAWEVPLAAITWPTNMEKIHLDVQEDGISVSDEHANIVISQWHLPQELTDLVINYISITSLPDVWPVGLRDFTCTHVDDKVSALSMMWPDIGRKMYYMPHSTMCFLGVIDESDRFSRTIMVHPNKNDGRPMLTLLD